MQGRDLTGVLYQKQDMSQWREAVFMEDLFLVEMFKHRYSENVDAINEQLISENKSYRSRGVSTGRCKYIVFYEHTPKIEELYDLEDDPYEQHNLALDPVYQDKLVQLRVKTEEMYRSALQ